MTDGNGPSGTAIPDGGGLEARRRPYRGWVGLVANRSAGTGQGRARVLTLVRALRAGGYRTRIAWTPEARSLLVDRAAREPQARCLVAVGGDGTVAALLNERPGVPVTVLACGTENLFARHFGLGDPKLVADAIMDGRVYPMDVGRARGYRFSLMAGFGFDADVVTRHHRQRTALTGSARPTNRVAYVEPVVRSSLGYRFPTIQVDIGDEGGPRECLLGTSVFVFNLPRYALGLPFAPDARADDGLLDLVVFRDPGPLNALRYLWLVLRGLHLKAPGVEHRHVRRLVVRSDQPVPFQLDGDPGGSLDSEGTVIEVEPHAVDIVVPQDFH